MTLYFLYNLRCIKKNPYCAKDFQKVHRKYIAQESCAWMSKSFCTKITYLYLRCSTILLKYIAVRMAMVKLPVFSDNSVVGIAFEKSLGRERDTQKRFIFIVPAGRLLSLCLQAQTHIILVYILLSTKII